VKIGVHTRDTQLEDQTQFSKYNIGKGYIINLVLQLHGEVVVSGMPSTSKAMSFKDVVNNNSTNSNSPNPSLIHSAYIVEHVEEVPIVDITVLEVTHLHSLYLKYSITCRLNGYKSLTWALFYSLEFKKKM
jgi:hypothetical protein